MRLTSILSSIPVKLHLFTLRGMIVLHYAGVSLIGSIPKLLTKQHIMFNFLRINFRPQLDTGTSRRLSTGSMYAFKFVSQSFANRDESIPADGIDVCIGKLPHARKMHVSHAVFRATPALRKHVSEGAIITNTDPIIFRIALQYIEQNGFFKTMRPVAINPLQKLIGSSDMMLKLVKTWRLGRM